ncbi:2-iminobutanoate/2-iminopropanoate deaminase [anaerobic digester metagenome]
MKKKAILVDNAPAAVGPYSHANVIGDLVFVSGQLPMKDGIMQENIPDGTRACLTNVKNILEGAGSSMEQCVKVTVFLRDMNDFAAMNEVYAEFFTENQPARSCFAVAGLPKDARIEIEAIAHI